jgi:hypothetical protein
MDSKTEMARESVITVLTASAIEEPELWSADLSKAENTGC